MSVTFEWDAAKADSNSRKHGVGFREACSCLGDPLSLTVPDPEHSEGEQRYVLVGVSSAGRVLVVVHRDDGDTIRIISARLATKSERRRYET